LIYYYYFIKINVIHLLLYNYLYSLLIL